MKRKLAQKILTAMAYDIIKRACHRVIYNGAISSSRWMSLQEMVTELLAECPNIDSTLRDPLRQDVLIESLAEALSEHMRPVSSYAFYKRYNVTMLIPENDMRRSEKIRSDLIEAMQDINSENNYSVSRSIT